MTDKMHKNEESYIAYGYQYLVFRDCTEGTASIHLHLYAALYIVDKFTKCQ